MEGRKIPNRLPGLPPVAEAEAIPIPPGSGQLSPQQLVMSAAAAAAEEEPMRQKKRKRKEQKEQAEVVAAPSQSPRPPATPEPKPEASFPHPPETLSSEVEPTAVAARRKDRRRKKRQENQEEAAPAPATSPLLETVEEAGGKEGKKKRKGRKHEEAAASPSQPAAAGPPILEGDKAAAEAPAPARSPLLEPVGETRGKEGKKTRKGRKHEEATASPSQPAAAGSPILEGDKAAAAAAGRRKRRRGKVEQEQSNLSPLPSDNHLQGGGGEDAADGPKRVSVTVRRSSSSKKPRVLSNREIIRMRIEARKQQPPPEGLLDAIAMAAKSTEQDPKYSSPFGAFFDRFRYEPDRQKDHNSPALHKTPDRPSRPPPQGQPTSVSSQLTANEIPKVAKAPLTANEIPKAAKTTTLNPKRPRSASTSSSQEKLQSKDKGKPEKMTRENSRKPAPLLSAAEKRSEKYRRLPLDQLVPPPRSPHKLLQEKYASDPWKVIVICMLLNLTQGKQVRKIVKGFFKRYPDAKTACNADLEKMAEYLAPLGLQRVKANRIQKLSKAYVGQGWTYVTELCGVGKYAADAYAIFCAGRAREVVPEDHKLVDYWKYVCFELPVIQESQRAQEAGVIELENVVPSCRNWLCAVKAEKALAWPT